jgi:hypothetical protein
VVRFGGQIAICKASVRTQEVFLHFEILRLETSIRQQNDLAFSAFLDSIGDDYEHETVDLGRLHHTRSVHELIDFIFPPDIVSDPAVCISRAILSPYNAFVDEFNESILNNVPGISHCYLSKDSIEEDVQGSNDAVYDNPEFLVSLACLRCSHLSHLMAVWRCAN